MFVTVAAGGCSSGGPSAADAARVAAVDAAGVDAAADAGVACTPGCGADQFCAGTGSCVSAVVAVAAGSVHTCAVHRDGHVSCWGSGPFIAPGLPDVTPPVRVEIGGQATALAVGIQAACALLADHTVRCWGEFGGGAEPAAPVVTEDGAPLGEVSALAGGSLAFCAINPRGTYCWGDNRSGELARPATMTFPSHTAVLSQPGPARLVAASVAVLVLDGAGRLCGWGNNDSGLAPGPHQVLEQPSCRDGLTDLLQLSPGDGHLCARRGGPRMSCWGSNSGGQLATGDENTLEEGLPGTTVVLPADIDTIASGAYHACALLTTGAVSCWGSNDLGECGLRSSAPLFSPRLVDGLTDAIAIGSGAGAQHTCVIVRDGSVRCWGYDDDGQLGTGATTTDSERYSPTPLPVAF